MMTTPITRKAIIAEARTWLKTPYKHQGRKKGVGVDCIGLPLGVGEVLGICGYDSVDYRRYGRRPPRGSCMLEYFDRECGPRRTEHEPGDMLVFWMNPITRRAQHIGIETDRGIIHTYADIGLVVEHALTAAWREKLICAYRFPGVG